MTSRFSKVISKRQEKDADTLHGDVGIKYWKDRDNAELSRITNAN